jgi:Protein of unknown function (DUF1638)
VASAGSPAHIDDMNDRDAALPELSPGEDFTFTRGRGDVLLIACGALAREIVALVEANRWRAFDVQCLPAIWHNTPSRIPDGVRRLIRSNKDRYRSIFVIYGDCGTGGQLDKVLAEEGVERIAGPHCYSFLSGNEPFAEAAEHDLTSFFVTDYLARHFDKLVWEGLGIAAHPELLPLYFGNYTRLVYLAQTRDPALEARARDAAARLGLAFELRFTGYGELDLALTARA